MTFTLPNPDPSPALNHSYFLTEAQDLLKLIEQGVFRLRSDRTPAVVHELMRAAHTLKGAAISVELGTISNVAHVLEDIFRAFYNPDVEIDLEIEGLLFEGYECLRLLLTAQFEGSPVDESDILNRAADIIAQLQAKLGDRFNPDTPIPTSAELGFDMVQSMFEIGVTQQLEELAQAVASPTADLIDILRSQSEIFLGLGESLELPGFASIAQTTLTALEHHPEAVEAIAQAALADLSQGRAAVLAGDRQQGGIPSPQLQQFASQLAQPPTFLNKSTSASLEPFLDTFLDGLMRLLLTEIPVESWLQRLKSRIATYRKLRLRSLRLVSSAVPNPLISDASVSGDSISNNSVFDTAASDRPAAIASFAEQDLTADLPPTLPLEALLDNFMPLSDDASSQTIAVSSPENSLLSSPVPASEGVSFKSPSTHPAASPLTTANASVRVTLEKLETLNYLTGELLIHQNQQTSQDETLHAMVQELLGRLQKHQQTIDELCSQGDRLFLSHQPQGRKDSAKLSSIVQQFDELEMDRYSEIHVLTRATLHEVMELRSISEALDQTSRQFRRSLEAQQRLLFTLGNDLTAIRMQPLEELFHRLAQVIQQLSISHHKPVQVAITGNQVLVDKTIVEKLYDPLLHLVRNAFDHGIEQAEIRQAMGKPAMGRIEINAYHQGHRTLIEVKDDGPGINLDRVAQRAVDMGWLSEEAIATTPESTLLSYLFKSGFSTATQVSSLSGRGVGLDVVRSQIEGFGGSVSVSFIPRQGTTFSLQIPLSFTIAKLLLCKDQGIHYALPIDTVEQIVSQPDSLLQIGNQQVLRWHKGDEEMTIVVRPLSDLIGSDLTSSKQNINWGNYSKNVDVYPEALTNAQLNPSKPLTILLVSTSAGLMGIAVEQVIGEQELVIRPFGRAIAPPPHIYGCCIVASSQLALVIDARMLFQQIASQPKAEVSHPVASHTSIYSAEILSAPSHVNSAAASLFSKTFSKTASQTVSSFLAVDPPIYPTKQSPQNFHVLVIDDSLTLRQTLTQLLQQAGYQISQAKDGLEGLAFLQKHPDINLVLCDIEMPRMNGFEFLSQHHQHLSLPRIPVIMLTSRSGAKYRQFALDLGAADFITKPYVEQNLLSTIHHLLIQR